MLKNLWCEYLKKGVGIAEKYFYYLPCQSSNREMLKVTAVLHSRKEMEGTSHPASLDTAKIRWELAGLCFPFWTESKLFSGLQWVEEKLLGNHSGPCNLCAFQGRLPGSKSFSPSTHSPSYFSRTSANVTAFPVCFALLICLCIAKPCIFLKISFREGSEKSIFLCLAKSLWCLLSSPVMLLSVRG